MKTSMMRRLCVAAGLAALLIAQAVAQDPYPSLPLKLIVPFTAHEPGTAPDGRAMDKPYHSATYDFQLVRA